MQPHVKPQILLKALIVFIMIFSLMPNCASEFRQLRLMLHDHLNSLSARSRFLRIENYKVIAKKDSPKNETLFFVPIERHKFLIYDKKSELFICWKRNYTSLIGKRIPRVLPFCTFEEVTSPNYSVHEPYTSYKTTRKLRNQTTTDVFIEINRRGEFATPQKVRQCKELRRKHGKSKIKQFCEPIKDFLPWKSKNTDSSEFCNIMQKIRHKHKLPLQLRRFCRL